MKSVSALELLGLFLSTLVQVSAGLDGCGRELVSNTTLTTELQSDVMLPCHFETALFRSDKAQDIAVVWSKINTPVFNLLEFKIYGNSRHWVSKDRRTKGFPKLSSSENFSIILLQAQFLDQGLYHCELFKGINCTIAYQELHLSVSRCRSKPLARIDIATELQSDVLLPCFFKPDILGSHMTADITAVWSQQDVTADNLLEVKLQGEVMFWKNRSGRIIPFPEYSESGNFSILLRNVQRSDLGLYRCELFRGHSCAKAYQEVTVSVEFGSIKYLYLLLGAAVILSLLLVSSCCMRRRNTDIVAVQRKTGDTAEPLYENTNFHPSRRETKEDTIYENDMELSKMKNTNRKCCEDPTPENSIYVNSERTKK